MAGRLIAQIIVQGTAVFTRVFIAAYQQALQNAKRGGGSAAASSASFIKGKMLPDEAMKILSIEKESLSRAAVDKQYKKLYEINDPGKGGSFYIQSKIFRAKEALEKSMTEPEKAETNDKK
eukprot:gene9923-20632_t